MHRQSSFAFALCFVAAGLAAQEARAVGAWFEVVVHGGDERLAQQALAVVEPVWPRVRETFGVRDAAPAERLEVHLYRTVEGYLAADERLTGGRFGPNQAMSHWGSKSSHVAVQPPVTDAFLAERGLPHQTLAMLAWEACHIARYELCPNFRSHPGWFGDGLAATTAQQVMAARGPAAGRQPFFEARWRRVRRMLDDGELPRAAPLLRDETQELDMRDRYAARVAWFAFLREERPEELRAFAAVVRSTGGGTGYAKTVRAAAEEAFAGMDDAFTRYARELDVRWDEALRSLWCDGDEWQQIAFADRNAVAWSAAPCERREFRIEGAVRILPSDGQQMNLLVARTDEGFYSLAIYPGGFTLFDHRYDGNQWRRVGEGKQPKLRRGEDVAFVVRGEGAQLDVQLAGGSWSFELPRPLPEQVVWGVGAQAGPKNAATGTAGVWRGVTAL